MHVVARSAGVSWEWAYEVDRHMSEAGLANIHSLEHGFTTTGGAPGCLLYSNYIQQVETRLLDVGITAEELRRYHELMRDPRFRVWSFLRVVFTRGQKPG